MIVRVFVLAASALLLVLAAGGAQAEPWQHAAHPWKVIGGGYDSAVHVGRILPVPFSSLPLAERPMGGGVLFMGADRGGLSRSLDHGRNWENVNGGPGFSDSLCGGYGDDMMLGCSAKQGQRQPMLYGGPPSAIDRADSMMAMSDVASGPLPPGAAAAAAAVGLRPDGTGPAAADRLVYRANNQVFASPDAGRQWFPLAPQCRWGVLPHVTRIAADDGAPGHLVLAHDVAPTHGFDIAGCVVPHWAPSGIHMMCGRRDIAWTTDVSPQLQVSLAPNDPMTAFQALERAVGGLPAGYKEPDQCPVGDATCKLAARTAWTSAKKWRYASTMHLAAAQVGQPASTCSVVPHVSGLSPSVPSAPDPAGCKASEDAPCHGRRPKNFQLDTGFPVDDPTAWCQDPATCKCNTNTTACRYPSFKGLTIDPRNGFVYASSQVGLLLSRNGGKWWERFGKVGPIQDAMYPWPGEGKGRGARLLTWQRQPGNPTGNVATDDNAALDLNAFPERILRVDKVSVAWTPCTGADPAQLRYANSDEHGRIRQRGRLVATVPVEWQDPDGRVLSSVFVAVAEDACQPLPVAEAPALPGPLVFRDTSSLLKSAGTAVLGDPCNPTAAPGRLTPWRPSKCRPFDL